MADYTITVDRTTPIGTSHFEPGVNIIDQTLYGDATAVSSARAILSACARWACTHTMWFGPYNPWRSAAETESQMHWANESGEPDNLDYRFDALVASGNAIAVTLGLTPTWMCTDDGSLDGQNLNSTYQTTAPTVAHFADMAELARRLLVHMRARYGVNVVERLQLWNELKGFWSVSLNRWRYEDVTSLYNQVWAVVQAFNATLGVDEPPVLMGGIYPSLSTGGPVPGPNTTITLADGSHVDPRNLDALLYWRDHAHGYDFVCCDGCNKSVDRVMPWFAAQFPNVPVIWNEYYSGYFDTTTAEDQKRAQLAVNLVNCVRSGVTSAYLWQPERRPQSQSGDAVMFNDQCLWTSTASAGGGQRTATADILQALKEHFPPGTSLYATTITPSTSSIVALASDASVLVVNNTASAVTVGGPMSDLVLAAYQTGLAALAPLDDPLIAAAAIPPTSAVYGPTLAVDVAAGALPSTSTAYGASVDVTLRAAFIAPGAWWQHLDAGFIPAESHANGATLDVEVLADVIMRRPA